MSLASIQTTCPCCVNRNFMFLKNHRFGRRICATTGTEDAAFVANASIKANIKRFK